LRFLVLSVGKPRDRVAGTLYDEYCSRMRKLGADVRSRFVPEVPADGRYTVDHAKQREARSLVAAIPDRTTVVALDRSGTEYDTLELARTMERWSARETVFVIGGPHGLHSDILETADAIWSMSRLTFPHELARVILAEQLYRGLTLIRGIPYHK
jgi:23S rRNA (pseudouridine1915-N3)-methyltransferase